MVKELKHYSTMSGKTDISQL